MKSEFAWAVLIQDRSHYFNKDGCFIIAFYILIDFSELGVKRNVKTSFQKATLACATPSMITLWIHLNELTIPRIF